MLLLRDIILSDAPYMFFYAAIFWDWGIVWLFGVEQDFRQKFCCLFINDYICKTINGIAYEVDKRNLTISSVIMVIGIGGGMLKFAIGKNFTFSLGGVALATLVGILLNLIIPEQKKSKEETASEK